MVKQIKRPCVTMGLVPRTREIKGGNAWPSTILFSMVIVHSSSLIAFASPLERVVDAGSAMDWRKVVVCE